MNERVHASVLVVATTLRNAQTVELLDISQTGARIGGESMPDCNEELFLSLGNLYAYGTVAWSTGNSCGVTFDPPLHATIVGEVYDMVREARGLSAEMCAARDAWNGGPIP